MKSKYTLVPYGPRAWLARSDDHRFLKAVGALCDRMPPPGFIEWVIAYDSLLLIFEVPFSESDLESFLEGVAAGKDFSEGRRHEISVCYDGPDLSEIAAAAGLSRDEVIKLHASQIYTVRFLGFAPGFAYLDGLAPELVLPRRSEPRARMEPGAVAIGGPHTGVYTVPSPGGWNWLGNTGTPLFDPATEHIALRPGDTVKFVPENE